MNVFNIRAYGAQGDGSQDDSADILSAMKDAAANNGALYIPAGDYVCARSVVLNDIASRFAIFGDGPNISRIIAMQDGIRLGFLQNGAEQPYGVVMRGVGIKARGDAGTGLTISYGQPPVTSDHFRPAVSLSDVQVESSESDGAFRNGVLIEGAWNSTLRNVFISGSSKGGVWNDLSGNGLELRGMCVNAHLANVRCNFWKTGLQAHGTAAGNTEGIFASNCSMVGVQRGVWIAGAPRFTSGRISTLTWHGGLIELRVKGVAEENGKAAFHLQNLWTGLICGAQAITDTLETEGLTYGVIAQDCHGIVTTGCDINAFRRGVFTTGACRGINTHGNTFTNTANQVHYTGGTSRSRSYGNVRVNDILWEKDDNDHLLASERNVMGFA